MPIRLDIDEIETTQPCPTCVAAELEGTVTIRAAADREKGTTPVRCTRGHMVMVAWHREPPS